MTEVETSMARTAVRPFWINVPKEALVDLRRRILATRGPDKETVADRSQGVPLATMQELARYWTTEQTASRFCWRQCGCKSTVSDRHIPAGLHRLALTHSEPLFVRCGAWPVELRYQIQSASFRTSGKETVIWFALV